MIRLHFTEIERPTQPLPDQDLSLLDGDEEFWLRVDEHRCEMGDACCASEYGFNPLAPDQRSVQPERLGTWLVGENDEPRWYQPWQATVEVAGSGVSIFICEECHEEWCRAAVKMMTMVNQFGDFMLINSGSFKINVGLPDLEPDPPVNIGTHADPHAVYPPAVTVEDHDLGVDESRTVRAQPEYPFEEGDTTVIGPECFYQDGVIFWKGEVFWPDDSEPELVDSEGPDMGDLLDKSHRFVERRQPAELSATDRARLRLLVRHADEPYTGAEADSGPSETIFSRFRGWIRRE